MALILSFTGVAFIAALFAVLISFLITRFFLLETSGLIFVVEI